MSEDIVTRLRAVLHNDRSVELMNREAADEIERLRAERDGYLEGNRQTLAALAEANEIAKKYKAERDEARCDACVTWAQMYRPPGRTETEARKEAKRRGWDCFKEAR